MAKKSEVTISLKDRVSSRLRKIEKGFGSLVKSMTKVGAVGAGVATYFGGKFFAGAIKSSADFQEQLAKVGAVSGATTEQMDALRAAANEAGTNTRYTATEAAQGLEELARAGQSSTEAIETLNPVLQVAQGNAIEVADAATLVTTTLNQFGKGADYAATAADILTRGTQISAQNIEQLGNALEFAGPQARQMGLTLEETTALIGRLADQGFRGEKGGTALRNALIELQNPASAFRKELQGLGIHSDDFVEVLEQLEAKGVTSRDALLALGKRAGPAISALVAGGTADLRELIDELNNAGGSAERTAAQMDDNLPGALRGFASAFDAVRRRLVDPLLEPIQREISALTQKLREFAKSDAIAGLADKIKETFESAVAAVRGFVENFSIDDATRKAEDFLSATAGIFRTFVDNSKAAATGAGKVWNSFGLVFDIVKGAVTGAAAGVVQLAIAYQYLSKAEFEARKAALDFIGVDTSKYADKIRDIEISIGGLKAVQDRYFELAHAGLEGARENWSQLAGEIQGVEVEISDTAQGFDQAGQAAGDAADQAAELAGELENVGEAGEDAGEKAADGIDKVGEATEGAAGDVKTLNEKVAELGAGIREQLEKDAEAARAAFESTLDSQTATLEQKRKAFIDYAQAAIAANNGVVSSELQSQAAILGTTAELENLRQKVAEVKGEQVGAGEQLRRSVEQVGEAAGDAARKFGQVREGWRAEAQAIGGFLSNIVESWKGLNQTAADHMSRVLEKLGRNVRTTASYFSALAKETRELGRIQREQTDKIERLENAFQAGAVSANLLREATSFLNQDLLLLDQARLDNLRSQIDAARRSMESFRSSAVSALQDAQRELLQLQGSELDVLRMDAEAKIAELKAQLAQAPDYESKRALREAIKLQEQILAEKIRQLKATEAENRALQERQNDLTPGPSYATAAPTPSSSRPAPASTADPAADPFRGTATPAADPFTGSTGGKVVTIKIVAPDGLTAELLARDEEIANRVIEILGQLGAVDTGTL